MRIALMLAAALVLTGASWIDPHAKAREASQLYEKGDFDAATQKYNEALTDDPDSYLLQYNRGASLYRQEKFEDAAAAFGRAPAANPAEIAYNTANAKYRLGAAAAESDPQKALGLYAEALAAYRRAMGANPDDVDAKFNHELVEKKVEELKKKLEEQKQEQEQQHKQQASSSGRAAAGPTTGSASGPAKRAAAGAGRAAGIPGTAGRAIGTAAAARRATTAGGGGSATTAATSGC